jgi:hypothetical protein
VKAKMTARESKATQNLLAAIKAKADAKRKREANEKRSEEFQARRERIEEELEQESQQIGAEWCELNRALESAGKDVNLALQATHNELLTLPFRFANRLNHVSQKIRNKSNEQRFPPDSRFRCC